MPPKVSVALPCYNAGQTLPAALDSLLAQTLPDFETDFEIVAVDDGSLDNTWDILIAYAGRDARLRPMRLPHQGVALAGNAAVAQCRAPFIARMDADDISLPRRLELQCALLDADPTLDLVTGLVRFGGDRQTRQGYAAHVDWLNSLRTHDDISLSRFVESPLANPSVMFRRASFERFGGAQDNLSGAAPFPEDYEQWLRWLSLGARVGKVGEDILIWNDPPSRLSRTGAEYSVEAFSRIKAGYLWDWLATHNPQHPEVVVWGAGRVSRKHLDPLAALGLRVRAYIDIDPKKIGQRVHGAPVLGREALPPCPADASHSPATPFVLVNVASRGAREEIMQWLAGRGYRAGERCVAVG